MYRSVVSQQGRVTLEADANEADEIRAAESRAELIDIIGPSGAPGGGFAISVPASTGRRFDFAIGEGTLYVGGVRVHHDNAKATYYEQDRSEWVEYPIGRHEDREPAGPPPFTEAVYLTVTEQEVSGTEDRALREPALGGPDTAARTRLIQRVQRMAVPDASCEAAFEQMLDKVYRQAAVFDSATMLARSKMRLRVEVVRGDDKPDPCEPTKQTGFLGPENQLIRVQVSRDHRMLWGWDNAAFLYRVRLKKDSLSVLELDGPPVDVYHHPRANQCVEVLGTAVDLRPPAEWGTAVDPKNFDGIACAVGHVKRVAKYEPTQQILTLTSDLPKSFSDSPPPQMFLRVWENESAFPATTAAFTDLEQADRTKIGIRVFTNDVAKVPGDYWMIGVRPSTPAEVLPARLTTLQPPDGPNRWVVPLALISWRADQPAEVTDCRRHIHDLGDDDDGGDLEFHNKHLHGWGVVCGLQVHCMTTAYASAHQLARPGEWVIVRDGYAIHPTGADIRLHSANAITPVALGDLAVAEQALTRASDGTLADGSVSLWIDKDRTFHADKYDPATKGLRDLLDGTILLDIYNDCILKLVEFFRTQITPGANDGPVGPAAKRLIAVTNLLWQLVNQTSGPHIYLSGEPDPARRAADTEDAILRTLFEGLKELLQSKTFCAMFDDVAYPPYDVYRADLPEAALHPATIFGTGRHTRIRVHPRGSVALTCGMGGQVNVYDVQGRKLLASVDFPVPGAEVQDIAFVRGTRDIRAIAWTGAAKTDSVFAAGRIGRDGSIAWSSAHQVNCPQMKLVTLVTAVTVAGDESSETVFAAARGDGIYAFATRGAATPPTRVSRDFRATGHLVAGTRGGQTVLYAGAHSTDANPVAFELVWGIDVSVTPAVISKRFTLPEPGALGHDDLAILPSPETESDNLCAIIDGAGQPTTKRLVVWKDEDLPPDRRPNALIPVPPETVIDLGTSGGSRIAYSAAGHWAMITYEDTYLGRTYRPGEFELGSEIHPLQIGPAAIAADASGRWFYVLESLSNTITAIPVSDDRRSTIDMTKLESYRRASIAAFLKMIGRTAQFLKDCACEHLLVRCPTGEGKVYLADVSFKDGKVYQICNFHGRKYVHTFPTVEYWLSIIPVIPVLKYAVERVCCSVVGGFFDTLGTRVNSDDKKRADVASAVMLRHGLTHLKSAEGSFRMRTSQAGTLGRTALQNALRRPSPGNTAPPTSWQELVDKSPEDARKVVADKGLTVRHVEVAPSTFRAALSIATEPTVVRGDTIDLVTDSSGRVLGIKKVISTALPVDETALPSPSLPTTRTAAAPAVGDEVVALRRELATMTESHARHAATIAEMQKKLSKMAKTLDTLRK
jgi:hypothetical protein